MTLRGPSALSQNTAQLLCSCPKQRHAEQPCRLYPVYHVPLVPRHPETFCKLPLAAVLLYRRPLLLLRWLLLPVLPLRLLPALLLLPLPPLLLPLLLLLPPPPLRQLLQVAV